MISRRSFNAALTGLVAGVSVPAVPTIVLKAEFAAHIPSILEIESHVAHALVRAVSPLLATPAQASRGVEMCLDTARTSACAASLRNSVFELRIYRSTSPRLGVCLEKLFPHAGIHPLLRGNLAYLIPFESLTAREQAWNALNADPEWAQVCRDVDSYQFGLYRVSA